MVLKDEMKFREHYKFVEIINFLLVSRTVIMFEFVAGSRSS